jgi:TIR domain-containing protein
MAKTRRRVFISAAASDAPRVRDLTERLKAAGVEAWNSAIEALPGANVSAEMGRAIGRADAIVVLVSPAAMKSAWVRREIQFALGQERFENRLIPVLIKRTPSNEIPWILRDLQWAKGNTAEVAKKILTILSASKTPQARAQAS